MLIARPVLFVVAGTHKNYSLTDMITASSLPARVCTIICTLSQKSVYSPTTLPINLFRNVALSHAMTSHVLFLDSDMRIPGGFSLRGSCVASLHDALTPLPEDNEILIVPTVFLTSHDGQTPNTKEELRSWQFRNSFSLSRKGDKSTVGA